MNPNRIFGAFLKLVLLVAGVVLLFWLWRGSQEKGGEPPEEAVKADVAVQMAKVARGTLRQYVTAYGVVTPQPAIVGKPSGTARIMSPLQGAITEVQCAEGQRVEKGASLFKLDSRMVDAAVEKARQTLAFAEQTYSRQQELAKGGSGALKNLQEAEQQLNVAKADLAAATTQQSLLKISAPLAGTVVRLQASPGEVVDLTTVLAEITDLEHLVVTANVPSSEISRLKVGQTADVTANLKAGDAEPMPTTSASRSTPPAPDTELSTVTFISPSVDPKTDLGTVLLSVPPAARFGPGQFLQASILVEERKDRLVVPVESIVHSEEGQTVVCLMKGDTGVQTLVKTGLREGDRIEIEGEGIAEGQAVLTVGAYGLPNNCKVHLATAALAATEPSALAERKK